MLLRSTERAGRSVEHGPALASFVYVFLVLSSFGVCARSLPAADFSAGVALGSFRTFPASDAAFLPVAIWQHLLPVAVA
ncbi:hypothetical protein AYO39_02365 [Actinobacteria bacterium SCGC AG-212-D09]|nr:hypothetical protein AYO39_02365 [Actinobacteria bacterium SCGC AG-212-D09]